MADDLVQTTCLRAIERAHQFTPGTAFDFSLVKLPVFDADGYPIQSRGITEYPGLFFVGLPWLRNAKSGERRSTRNAHVVSRE